MTLSLVPNEGTYLPMTDMNGKEIKIDAGHAVNVIDIDGNDIYIDTCGGIFKIDIEDLKENTSYFNFVSYELVEK